MTAGGDGPSSRTEPLHLQGQTTPGPAQELKGVVIKLDTPVQGGDEPAPAWTRRRRSTPVRNATPPRQSRRRGQNVGPMLRHLSSTAPPAPFEPTGNGPNERRPRPRQPVTGQSRQAPAGCRARRPEPSSRGARKTPAACPTTSPRSLPGRSAAPPGSTSRSRRGGQRAGAATRPMGASCGPGQQHAGDAAEHFTKGVDGTHSQGPKRPLLAAATVDHHRPPQTGGHLLGHRPRAKALLPNPGRATMSRWNRGSPGPAASAATAEALTPGPPSS